MKQNYHMNANTNSHSRVIIHRAKASNTTLAHRFGVSTKTILLFVVEKKLICYGNYHPNLGGSLRV
jgi:hypothetical protein